MWAVISGVVQIIFLILKNKFEKDEVKRKAKEALHAEVGEAIKSHNVSRINVLIGKLR